MKNEKELKDHFRRELAAQAYENQSTEQRQAFIKRISYLNAVKINRAILVDAYGHVLSAQPEDKRDPMYRIFKDVLKYHKESIESTKMLDVRVSNLLKTSNNGQELVDMYAWYNAEILQTMFSLDLPKQELALDVVRAIGCETFNAQSDDDYENNMINFGNYCMQLAQSGRKKVTKNDFNKFKNK